MNEWMNEWIHLSECFLVLEDKIPMFINSDQDVYIYTTQVDSFVKMINQCHRYLSIKIEHKTFIQTYSTACVKTSHHAFE